MPIHDWKNADAGLFHHFHQRWTGELCDGLNAGVLPDGYFALVDLRAAGMVPDVLTLGAGGTSDPAGESVGGIAVAANPPKTRFVSSRTDAETYAGRANRVAVRNAAGRVVAVVEVVSPGNKHSRHAIRAFRDKAVDLLARGVHLLLVDLFPPSRRDPQGVHKVVWDQIRPEPFELPPDKRLTLASYVAEPVLTAYVEPVAVGDALPPMPLFVDTETYVYAPLEETYLRTWEKCPAAFRRLVESGTPSA